MKYIVAVYLQDRAFGGPEEGGWWYDTGNHVRTMRVFGNESQAIAYSYRLNEKLATTLNRGRRSISSILSTGRYGAEVYDDFAPKHYPVTRPHYE